MRELSQRGALDALFSGVFSATRLWTINEPLLPNLKFLRLWAINRSFIPFIPFLLSSRTISISLTFGSDLPNTMIASTVTALSVLCPNLQTIKLDPLPRDPMITAAVSWVLLVASRNTLQELYAGSPLTEEASEVLYKLPNLRSLSVVIDKETSLPPVSLPNLTKLEITCHDEDDWVRLFRGATLGQLESVTFRAQSKQIGDFLGAFERAALSSSVHNTLSTFNLFTTCSWNLKYPSLLPFTQMVDLDIRFSCDGGCSSTVDDDVVISLSRAMPKLEILGLGDDPCFQPTSGVTPKGLLALAHRCPSLSLLCIHFQADSLNVPAATPGMIHNAEPAAPSTDCALTEIVVGETPVPEGSALTITLTLLRIFPRIDSIEFTNDEWEEVDNAIK